MADKVKQAQGQAGSLLQELPLDRLKDEMKNVASAVGVRAVGWVEGRVSGAADKLNSVATGGGNQIVGRATEQAGKAMAEGSSPVKTVFKAATGALSGVKEKVTQAFGGGGGGDDGGENVFKATHIIEDIDIGAPIDVVYNQWTQYEDFPDFMKKVETVEQKDDTTTRWRAQVLWSHRQWDATVLEQVPEEKIMWRSEGEKGHVDGCVTFHELAPSLTRVVLVMEYYPKGLFEKTGNIWRAQGRRARLELKHFRRHVMMNVMHGDDGLEGWRGEIHDGEVTRSHEEAVDAEQAESEEEYEEQEGEPEEEYDEQGGEPEDEYEEQEGEPEAEYEAEEEAEEEPEEKPAPRRRRRSRS